MRNRRQTLVAAFMFALALAAGRAPAETVRALPQDVLILEGDGYALGQKQGQALKDEILTLYNGWLVPKLRSVPLLFEKFALAKAHNMEPFIPQAYRDEIRGLADTVGFSYDMGLIVNAVPDIMELANHPFGCSTFVSLPQRSEGGALLYGRNLDYAASDMVRPHWRPTVFARPGKHRILSVNVPGMSGVLTAINDRGVMMSRMTSYSGDIRSDGVPSMLLFRQVLETADSAEEAAQLYQTATRTVAINVMISDKDTALVFESTARHSAIRRPNDANVLYSANHFESPSLHDGIHGRDARWRQLSRFDGTTEKLTFGDVLETLARTALDGRNILAVVVDYGRKTLTYGSDPEHNGVAARGRLYEIDLTEVLPGI